MVSRQLQAIGLVLLGMATACSPSYGCRGEWDEGERIKVWVQDDPNISGEERQILSDCLQEWEEATDGWLDFVVVSDPSDAVITIEFDTLQAIKEETGWGAWTYYEVHEAGGDILMPNDAHPVTLRRLCLHEVGHAIGLDHGAPGTVMMNNTNHSADEVTCSDVWQLCGQSGCDALSMPPCEGT